jgi:hypothetical protein
MGESNITRDEYLALINELLACNGIGSLITVIQNKRDKFDEDFFIVLYEEIGKAKDEGDNKRAGSLSYLDQVINNLQGNKSNVSTDIFSSEERKNIGFKEEFEIKTHFPS